MSTSGKDREKDWQEELQEYDDYIEEMEELDEELDEIDEELEEMRRGRGAVLRVIAFFTAFAFLGLVVLTSLPAVRAPLADLVSRSLQLERDIDVQQLQKAVVQIDVVARESIMAKQKSGTGFNIDSRGIIVTNHHVIEDARNMTIKFPNGEIFKADRWTSKPEMDLAVITLRGEGLPTVPLDSSNLPSPGDKVRVVGNPLGLNNIIADGKVEQYLRLKDSPERVFSIDAPVYPGNSGSPVFNSEGRVVGVIFATWKQEAEDKEKTVGLAVPVKEVLELAKGF
jgi:S1-C subfamily serine protease